MMKLIISLLTACLLIGCAATESTRPSVYTSDHREYDIYQDGEYICRSNSSCTFKRAYGSETFLEARKDSVVYGRLLVKKGKSENSGRADNDHFVAKQVVKASTAAATSAKQPMQGVLIAGFTVLALPVLFWEPGPQKTLPQEIMIPIVEPETSQPYPWDKPAE